MRSRIRPPQAVLPEPGEPAADLPEWGPVRLARAVARRWRRWMVVPLLLGLVAAALLVPVGRTADRSGDVVDASALVVVEVAADARIAAGGHTGSYLLPRPAAVGSALGWAVAAVDPARSLGPEATAALPPGVAPLDVALLAGAGVAPGRGEPTSLGLGVRVLAPDAPADRLGILLHVADQVSSQDLAAGRRILVVGAVTPDGAVRCAGDVATAIAAADPPVDLVLTGPGCAPTPRGADTTGPSSGPTIVEVGTLADALVALTGPGG